MKRILITAALAVLILTGALGAYGVFSSRGGSGDTVGPAHASDGLKAGDVDPKTGKRIKYWAAPMDPAYIRNEPGQSPMGMDLIPVYEEEGGEKEPSSTIRIDPVTVQNMGVRVAPVERKVLFKDIRALGTVTYDESRIFAVNTKFSGWIERLFVNFVGERVRKGQPLFDIYSPDLVTAQEEYRLALEQQRQLADSPYESVRDGARRLLDASRKRLRYWDLSESQIKGIGQSDAIAKTVSIRSPANGVVIAKKALEGHFVKAGEHLYEIADLSKIWVDVEIYEYELPYVKVGMRAEMDLAYVPGKRFKGRVLFVYPFLSPETRTAKLRLEFHNPDFELKPGMYANVNLASWVAEDALVIPQQAVIDSGVRKVVFVALGKGRFQPREVKLGMEGRAGEVQVLEGLKGDEQIVVSAQFMLDSESRLREVIQKMLEVRQAPEKHAPEASAKTDGLDMGDMSMEDMSMEDMSMDSPVDDLNMDDLGMDDMNMDSPPASGEVKGAGRD
jgi:membrane fusion protein, copper/silver efflux system